MVPSRMFLFPSLIIRTKCLFNYHREELFYQLGLRQFGDYSRLKLEPPPPLRAMVKLAVDAEEGTKNSHLSKNQIVDVSLFPNERI
jgi:hypothetical protein